MTDARERLAKRLDGMYCGSTQGVSVAALVAEMIEERIKAAQEPVRARDLTDPVARVAELERQLSSERRLFQEQSVALDLARGAQANLERAEAEHDKLVDELDGIVQPYRSAAQPLGACLRGMAARIAELERYLLGFQTREDRLSELLDGKPEAKHPVSLEGKLVTYVRRIESELAAANGRAKDANERADKRDRENGELMAELEIANGRAERLGRLLTELTRAADAIQWHELTTPGQFGFETFQPPRTVIELRRAISYALAATQSPPASDGEKAQLSTTETEIFGFIVSCNHRPPVYPLMGCALCHIRWLRTQLQQREGELSDVRAELRIACNEYDGANDWPDDTHLGDVIEKHLMKRGVCRERDAYRKAKQENDERFMLERDSARAERDRLLGRVQELESAAQQAMHELATAGAHSNPRLILEHQEHAENALRAALRGGAKP